MSKQVNYNENLVAGAAIRDDKGRRISKLFEASHPKMTVGYAKNLIMPDDPTEQEFNFRQAGGGVIEDGVAVIDKVKGNSMVWNQLVQNGNFADGTRGWSKDSSATWSISAGVIHIHKDGGEAGSTTRLWRYDSIPCVIGHKYLYLATVKTTSGKLSIVPTGTASEGQSAYSEYLTTTRLNYIWTANALLANFELRGYDNKIANTDLDFYASNINVFDLTLMFGAGNEPSSVEEFEAMFSLPYYAYNEGTIINNKVEKVVTTGRNLFDMSKISMDYRLNYGVPAANSARYISDYIPCVGSNICLRYGASYAFYDSDLNIISSENKSTTIFRNYPIPSGAKYARFDFVKADVEGKNNYIILGDYTEQNIPPYTPYQEHELDLSWVKEIKDAEGAKLFEDGMKSAGIAFDEVRKNKAVKRIEKVVFDGTEDWSYIPKDDKIMPLIQNFFPNRGEPSTIKHCKSNYYLEDYSGKAFLNQPIGTIQCRGDLKIADLWKSIEAWKQHLADLYAAGTPLVVYYELAEPIEVEYDEKNLTYPVVAGGTEEAIASEPSSAFRADIGYGIDAVKTILDLKARVEALEGK